MQNHTGPYLYVYRVPFNKTNTVGLNIDVNVIFFVPQSIEFNQHDYVSHQYPHKYAIMCQYWACTGPMLAASDQYRPGMGN